MHAAAAAARLCLLVGSGRHVPGRSLPACHMEERTHTITARQPLREPVSGRGGARAGASWPLGQRPSLDRWAAERPGVPWLAAATNGGRHAAGRGVRCWRQHWPGGRQGRPAAAPQPCAGRQAGRRRVHGRQVHAGMAVLAARAGGRQAASWPFFIRGSGAGAGPQLTRPPAPDHQLPADGATRRAQANLRVLVMECPGREVLAQMAPATGRQPQAARQGGRGRRPGPAHCMRGAAAAAYPVTCCRCCCRWARALLSSRM
jgi:hypothetical protein